MCFITSQLSISTKIDKTIFLMVVISKKYNWRTGVSIPVPLECESSALPFELVPLATKWISVLVGRWAVFAKSKMYKIKMNLTSKKTKSFIYGIRCVKTAVLILIQDFRKVMSEVGFEPTPTFVDQNTPVRKSSTLESGALDRSAILTYTLSPTKKLSMK